MPRYFRIVLGRLNSYAETCRAEGFVGTDFDVSEDLTEPLPENWKEFNSRYIPIVMKNNSAKTKIGANLVFGMLWTVSKGIQTGDVVISSTCSKNHYVGVVTSGYESVLEGPLQHRHRVEWINVDIEREQMSDALRRSTGSIGTVAEITKCAAELEKRISPKPGPEISVPDPTVEDPSVFALQSHLEEFLIANCAQTALGHNYNIYEEDGIVSGQQNPTDTGPIDILAIDKDGQELLVVELMRGRTSDSVVGQIQRYMGYVTEELAEPNQEVRGVIIALKDDV